MAAQIPPVVSKAVEAYLNDVDQALPRLVEGLYVSGSVGLGDFRPAISDIDLVAVCGRRPGETDLDQLARVHRPSQPSVDVLYITGGDLLSDPSPLSAPYSLEGAFYRDNGFQANPVTWRDLQTHGVPVRGPCLRESDVWFDADVLRRWNRDNLDRYWAGRLESWRHLDLTETFVRHQYGLQWLVLGVPRLHYTITTLEVTSKTGAGEYALRIVGSRWHPVIDTAIRLRADHNAWLPLPLEQLRQDAIDFVTWIVNDSHLLVPT
jgi:hypothetical protein